MTLNEIETEQVRGLLRQIDSDESEAVKQSVFGRLGRECFTARKLDRWIASFNGDVQAFLDRINVQHASKYWERLEFNADRTALVLTGRAGGQCACAYAEGPEPPLSLCHFCCKRFQEEIFGALLGREVEVEITEAHLLGGQRCSTIIHLAEAYP